MEQTNFRALVVDKAEGCTAASLRTLAPSDLPHEGDVLVRVEYSALNYKDGLAVTGKGRVIRKFPMVPGIDLAGVVVESENPGFGPGDPVLSTGWGLGELHWGGYAGMARLKSEWLTPLPEGLTIEQTMAIGTAGFTAMLSLMALEEHSMTPKDGPVVVTGAAGGVGSMAVALLAQNGYQVTASTGRRQLDPYLRELGASEIIDRVELARPAKALETERWGGAIDSVGGQTLATVLSQMRGHRAVAACGLAGGADLPTTVFPFILRGVTLVGIESAWVAHERRDRAWERLAAELPADLLEKMTSRITLDELPAAAEAILKGEIRGRVVVDLRTE